MCLVKTWSFFDGLWIKQKSDLFNKIELSFFQEYQYFADKARLKLLNNTSSIGEISEVTPHKTIADLPLITHLENYPNKTNNTCRTLLERLEGTHK